MSDADPPSPPHLLERIGSIGDRPTDTDAERLQHRLLIYMGVLMSGGGILWGTIAMGSGMYFAATFAYSYTLLTPINFAILSTTKNFPRARFVQVMLSLLLPFVFQWSLGGFAASGGVMLWGTLAIVGSLTFSTPRNALMWLFLYSALTVVSGVIDPYVRARFSFHPSPEVQTVFSVINILVISNIVFGLTIYLLKGRREVSEALEVLNSELEGQVDKRTEELQNALKSANAASEAKSIFLANMSHELRTPLNAIIGYSEILIEDVESADDSPHPTMIQDLSRIDRAGRHLLGLISQILDLSKIEGGKMELFREEVDLEVLITETLSTLEPLLRENSNTIETHIEGELGQMCTDLTKLRQVLLNLLSNATKFTSDGTITVHAKRDHSHLRVDIEDTGMGMSPDQIERVFDPFHQADASTTRNFGGTGLGLTITHRFVEMLGGTLEVRSELGQGSVFTVQIPIEC